MPKNFEEAITKLGFTQTTESTGEDIRKFYKDKLKKSNSHPDKATTATGKEEATKNFIELKAAYEWLDNNHYIPHPGNENTLRPLPPLTKVSPAPKASNVPDPKPQAKASATRNPPSQVNDVTLQEILATYIRTAPINSTRTNDDLSNNKTQSARTDHAPNTERMGEHRPRTDKARVNPEEVKNPPHAQSTSSQRNVNLEEKLAKIRAQFNGTKFNESARINPYINDPINDIYQSYAIHKRECYNTLNEKLYDINIINYFSRSKFR